MKPFHVAPQASSLTTPMPSTNLHIQQPQSELNLQNFFRLIEDFTYHPNQQNQHIIPEISNQQTTSWSTQYLNFNPQSFQTSQPTNSNPSHSNSSHQRNTSQKLQQLCPEETASCFEDNQNIGEDFCEGFEAFYGRYCQVVGRIGIWRDGLREILGILGIVEQYLGRKDRNDGYDVVSNYASIKQIEANSIPSFPLSNPFKCTFNGFKNPTQLILAQILQSHNYISAQSLSPTNNPTNPTNKLTQILKQAKYNYLQKSGNHLSGFDDIDEDEDKDKERMLRQSELLEVGQDGDQEEERERKRIVFPGVEIVGDLDELRAIKQEGDEADAEDNKQDQQNSEGKLQINDFHGNVFKQLLLKNSSLAYSIQNSNLHKTNKQKHQEFDKLQINLSISSSQPDSHQPPPQQPTPTPAPAHSTKTLPYQSQPQNNQNPELQPITTKQEIFSENCVKLQNQVYGMSPFGQERIVCSEKTVGKNSYYGYYRYKLKSILQRKDKMKNKTINQYSQNQVQSESSRRQPLQILRQHCRGKLDLNLQAVSFGKQPKPIPKPNLPKSKAQTQPQNSCKYFFKILVENRRRN